MVAIVLALCDFKWRDLALHFQMIATAISVAQCFRLSCIWFGAVLRWQRRDILVRRRCGAPPFCCQRGMLGFALNNLLKTA